MLDKASEDARSNLECGAKKRDTEICIPSVFAEADAFTQE